LTGRPPSVRVSGPGLQRKTSAVRSRILPWRGIPGPRLSAGCGRPVRGRHAEPADPRQARPPRSPGSFGISDCRIRFADCISGSLVQLSEVDGRQDPAGRRFPEACGARADAGRPVPDAARRGFDSDAKWTAFAVVPGRITKSGCDRHCFRWMQYRAVPGLWRIVSAGRRPGCGEPARRRGAPTVGAVAPCQGPDRGWGLREGAFAESWRRMRRRPGISRAIHRRTRRQRRRLGETFGKFGGFRGRGCRAALLFPVLPHSSPKCNTRLFPRQSGWRRRLRSLGAGA